MAFALGLPGPVLAAPESPSATDRLEQDLKTLLNEGGAKAPAGQQSSDPHGGLSEEQILQIALRHLHEGRADEALKSLEMGLAQYPRFHKFYGLRGSIYLSQSSFGSALGDLKAALDLHPDDPVLLVHRALAYRGFGSNTQAMADLDRAIELKPDMMTAYYNRGALKVKMNRLPLAEPDFRKAVELDPDAAEPAFNLAMLLKALGKTEEAIAEMERLAATTEDENWKSLARSHAERWTKGAEGSAEQ